MLLPTVTELPRRLEAVTRDDFADEGAPLILSSSTTPAARTRRRAPRPRTARSARPARI